MSLATSNDSPRPWHTLPIEQVQEHFRTNIAHGLSRSEVQRRLAEHGPNEVEVAAGPGPIRRFLLQFNQPLIYILIVAGVVTALLQEYVDSAVIFGVVILNAAIGYIQESRALSALAALSRTLARHATVSRDGEKHTVSAVELVPGDIVVVQSGDRVPADLRLVRVRELQVEEAAFTGESVPVFKSTGELDPESELAERTNMAYSSTLVRSGRGTGIVVATGTRTEVGRISELIESAEDIATPLTRRIAWFSRWLTVAILSLAVFTFLVGLAHGESPSEVFLASVALAVAVIPEGLPAVITITLAIGVSRMAARRAIIRKLPAVETLGSTTVICSDKTGTLTQNEMTVQRVWAGNAWFDLTGAGYSPDGEVTGDDAPFENEALRRCLLAGLLANDSSLVEEEGRWAVRGDPTEGALIVSAAKAGIESEEYEEAFPRLDSVPFESQQQYMATLHRPREADSNVVFIKGAAETVLQRCSNLMAAGGETVEFDPDDVLGRVRSIAENGLRVLALAEKAVPVSTEQVDHDSVAGGLTLLGLQGMIDPPRQEAVAAVRECRQAGITVKMITGDHAITASAISRELGIGDPSTADGSALPPAVSGRDLDRMDDDELFEVAQATHVFARIPPDGKLRLVRALQQRGHIVAMTGDGVNDGPALSQANVGVAMGLSGTEVAREAADMVLTDDNFASIVAAVEEGRGVFDNLTKFLVYMLPTSLAEGAVILLAILLGTTLPMLPVQVLWVNMTTAVLLGLTLAFEPREPGIMARLPRDPEAQMLTRGMGGRMLIVAVLMLVGAFGLFELTDHTGQSVEQARTVAVNVIVFVEILYLLNCRSLTEPAFALSWRSNPWVPIGISLMVALQLGFTYLPFMNTLFRTEPIDLPTWLLILGVGFLAFAAVEAEKWLRRATGRPITHRFHGLAVESGAHGRRAGGAGA